MDPTQPMGQPNLLHGQLWARLREAYVTDVFHRFATGTDGPNLIAVHRASITLGLSCRVYVTCSKKTRRLRRAFADFPIASGRLWCSIPGLCWARWTTDKTNSTRLDSIRLKITYESSNESSYLCAKTPHYSEYHSREEEVGLINQSINHSGLLVVGGYAVYIIAWNSCQAPYRSITGVKRPMKRQAFRV